MTDFPPSSSPPPSPPIQALAGQQLAPDLATRLQNKLQPNELLIWTGQPDPELYVRRAYILSVFGFLLLVIVAMAGLCAAFLAKSAFVLCPLSVFLVISVLLILTPKWLRHEATTIFYAVTNRRAITGKRTDIQSFPFDQIDKVRCFEQANGAGRIVFDLTNPGTRYLEYVEFLDLQNVRAVEELIQATFARPETET